MRGIRAGRELTKKSWALLRGNPTLLHFPLYAALLLDRVGVPRVDRAHRAEHLMRSLSRSDFGARSPWSVSFGRVQPLLASALGPAP
jgi:hypothetical protein